MASPRLSADDLLILLEVARSGRYTRAAEKLGLNHVTVSRRVSALETAVGGKVMLREPGGWDLTPLGERLVAAAERLDHVLRGLEEDTRSDPGVEDVVRISAPDAFSAFVTAPAAARVHRRHPGVSVEIVSVVRRAGKHRSGVDIEVVVGEPRATSAEVSRVGSYTFGLYASPEYIRGHGSPASLEDLPDHHLVYYISSLLQVEHIDIARRFLPTMRESVTSTNVFAHVEATRAGGGIGLLATFMADRHDDLTRILATEVSIQMDYWLVVHADTLRRPAVPDLIQELIKAMWSLEGQAPTAGRIVEHS